MLRRLIAALVVSLLGLASTASAQSRATSADLAGYVYDQSKAVLPGVTVSIVNQNTNLTRTVVTEASGRYSVPALPPGTYTVRVELGGFTTQLRENVILSLGTSRDLDFTLDVAAKAEEVTVVAQSPVVDISQTAVASVVDRQQIENLPINGRNFISFSVITPAVTTDRTPQQGASATSGLTFAGQRARSNNITVDGLDNNDSSVGSVRAVFSQEAVQEFQVLTNSYSAEFGKASGGVVNIVTKSGTNRFAGNAFFFFRDDSLNARSHFDEFDPAGNRIDRDKSPFGQKQFGATLGGPLKRDRLFFFSAFERLDINDSNIVNIDSTTPIVYAGMNFGTTVDVLQRAGFPVTVGNVPYDVFNNSFIAKLDAQMGGNQNLAFRFNWADVKNENTEPWGGQVAESRGAFLDSNDVAFGLVHNWIISSRFVNEARFQVAYRDQKVISLDPTCNGECDLEDEGGPTLEIGVIGVGRQRFTPQPRENTRLQFVDSLSYYLGRHQLKAGFDYSWVDNSTAALPLHFGGRYIFAALPAIPGLLPLPATGLQALALGVPAAYVQGYGDSNTPYTASDLSLFIQDDWRLLDNLTAKLGLRYQNQYWPSSTRLVPGLQPYEYPTDGNNFAPRIAVAWDPYNNKQTSIHGSYGIFYDNHITSVSAITAGIDGLDGVRTLVSQLPDTRGIGAWRLPGRRLPAAAAGTFPSLVISIDPALKTPYAHQSAIGFDQELGHNFSTAVNFVYARGKHQIGTIDYNPILIDLGAGRRPLDAVNPATGLPQAGTSASVLQYTSWGETWYKGLTVSLTKRLSQRYQLLAAYTLSKAEDTSADFQSFFIPQDNGRGRDPGDPNGLPINFNPDAERGASLQDQRHRFVVSGYYQAPWLLQVSTIMTLASGRPYNIIAGADLNADGNGGSTPPDRPRTNPADATTSIERNAGVLPNQYTIDVRVGRPFTVGRVRLDPFFEVFNLFNRTNYTEINNVFGPGAYPSSPLPTFGQFTQAAAPLQAQLAVKVSF